MGDGSRPPRGRSAPAVLELDYVFEALAHRRRRYLLYSLAADSERSLWGLARKVAAWEGETAPEEVPESRVERVYVSLKHGHVPMLVDDGIVEFDGATETIEPGPNAERALSILESAGGSHDSEQEVHARSDRNE